MTPSFVNMFRMTACSIAAVALAACARFSAPSDLAVSSDLNRGDAPDGLPAAPTLRGLQDAEDARLAALETQIVDLNEEISHLRMALDMMGPFDDIQASPTDLVEPRPMTRFEAGQAEIDLSEIYAPAPDLTRGVSLFHAVELGAYPTLSAAETDWARLTSEIDLSGLSPKFSDETAGVRLSAGPVMSAIEASSLCAELTALAGDCAPSSQWGALH